MSHEILVSISRLGPWPTGAWIRKFCGAKLAQADNASNLHIRVPILFPEVLTTINPVSDLLFHNDYWTRRLGLFLFVAPIAI